MTSARPPLLTDLVALVSFDGRVYPNEARPLERLGLSRRTRPLGDALEQWFSFATGKQTWVSVHGATIRGLISARQRVKRSVWEVEVLINASEDESIALSLFSRMTAGVLRQGAERVFLRLDETSTLMDVARKAGFFRYVTETHFRRAGEHWQPSGGARQTRSRVKNDAFGVYQLYNRAVPANVRAIEGATLREWQAAQEKWGSRSTELVLEEGGVIDGWVRAMPGNVGRISALTQGVPYEDVLATGLDMLQDREVLCLVPDHNADLASALGRFGFEPEGRYMAFAKRLNRPVEEMAPESAGEAVTAI